MTIYLNPEVKSGLNEDTFWTWFNREIPSEFYSNQPLSNNDALLQYSTMGKSRYPNRTICLLWELYPEMKEKLGGSQWNVKINKINEAKNSSARRVVASELMIPYYGDESNIDVLPIGVDTDLFKPLNNKSDLRAKYALPEDREIGVWCGTDHTMKGYDRLVDYAKAHPDIFWVIIMKGTTRNFKNIVPPRDCRQYIRITQKVINDLFNCGDFFLSTSRLQPFYMIEWEAMAANMPMRIWPEIEKDFIPSANPREDIFRLDWDRKSAKYLWESYVRQAL